MKNRQTTGVLMASVLLCGALAGAPLWSQESTMFLLDLPGDKVSVRYSHGSLDRAVQLQDNFDLLVEDFRGWTRAKVGLVILLLSREEWKESGFVYPYGLPEPAGGRGLALPSWGDKGTVDLWHDLLGTRLPTLPEQPMRGTPEQTASLAVADLIAAIDGAQVLLRAGGFRGDQSWVNGVISHVVVLANLQNHHAGRLPDVRMVFEDLSTQSGGPGAQPLSAAPSPPSVRARLWFESQYFQGAALLTSPGCKYSAKAIFKQARKNGGLIQAAELVAHCPELGTWLQSSFRSE